jgi:hypothetical protein
MRWLIKRWLGADDTAALVRDLEETEKTRHGSMD